MDGGVSRDAMTIVQHLEELRRRILFSLVCIIISSCAAYTHVPQILAFLKKPAGDHLKNLVFFSPAEGILSYIKLALAGGILLVAPVLLYQLWAFVSPALSPRQRRWGSLFILSGSVCFLVGTGFGYFVLLPLSLQFLLGFASNQLTPLISIDRYVTFVLVILGGCGLAFDTPVLFFVLAKLGVIRSLWMRRQRKYMLLLNFIIAAIITPTPDIFNMCLLALPLIMLYELSIWICKWAEPRIAE